MEEKYTKNEIENQFDISEDKYIFVENNDNIRESKAKKFIRQNPDKIILLAVAALSVISLAFASIFWVMSVANSVVMFAVFSCCVSCYGFYLSMKNFKE